MDFWIDVGGTFTDCLLRRPSGELTRLKVLSTGVTKGSVQPGSTANTIVDVGRSSDPPSVWQGYRLTLLDRSGQPTASAVIRWFDAATGAFKLGTPLDAPLMPGQTYELSSGEEAPLLAMRYLLGLTLTEHLPAANVRLGTTRGTNALLTRSGARVAFLVTRGFADILHIGTQNRPKLFALEIEKPEPLSATVLEVDERIAADGTVLEPLNEETLRGGLAALADAGIESLAICLLHAARHPQHEQRVAAICRECGFAELSISHQVAPTVRVVARGDTTVLDAYLNPILRAYIAELESSVGEGLRLMTSAGGLVRAAQFSGKDSLLSGPAGGVVGFARAAQNAGFARAIGFDMGGTSTDVARFDGALELEYETEKAGVRVVAPTLAIETVAAGGGSICRFDGVKLVVGPGSAGADPGPACYGRGGPLTITDVNLFLGKIPPDRFPFALDRTAVERRLESLAAQVLQGTGRAYSLLELCDGLVRVANATMARAIHTISLAKGYDPRDYLLVAFGGAAGQHACAVARELGIRNVLCHPDAGVLSAWGLGHADVVRHRAAPVYRECNTKVLAELAPVLARLESEARDEVLADGVPRERIVVRRALDLRYRGLDAFLTISEPPDSDYRAAYHAEHERLFGYAERDREIEIAIARVEVVGRSAESEPPAQTSAQQEAVPLRTGEAAFDARPCQVQVFDREALQPGDTFAGPAVVLERLATTVVDPGWNARVLAGGELLLTSSGTADARTVSTDADPVMLEIFNQQFASIAERMGHTLRQTASSVNVKERLDFSCALFTPSGDLVVNAPHIPVHLGAMSETVKSILQDHPTMAPGDVFVTNDPYRGGSHLPDVTVVTPVHDPASQRLLFFTASRAHHAEIGGIVPGSMPPFSRSLAEEGVLLTNLKLMDAGQPRFDALRVQLLSGPYPTRNVADNLADVTAQLAANRQGARDLARLIERHTLPVVEAYMQHIQRAAEQKTRAALAQLPAGEYRFVDHLDDGSPIAVTITPSSDQTTIDFTGTGPVLASNLNANRAIVTAAVMYVLRCLLGEEIPLNQGVLAPVRLVVPPGLLNPTAGKTPEESPAMVGGNVETSQRVVDVLLGALHRAAASQGTMNNLLFGDATFGYYETICGGAGATALRAGADAVHTHMTNTRLTDPEVLEQRYPVRLREFRIRRGSGGAGALRGGHGVMRVLEFLAPLTVSILSQRRGHYSPFGLAGGLPGARGRNVLHRANGAVEVLPGQAQLEVQPGDVLSLETPGGGGWGSPHT